jgi:hypothetical protein
LKEVEIVVETAVVVSKEAVIVTQLLVALVWIVKANHIALMKIWYV